MTNCKHTKTKLKLISRAIKFRSKHKQWFEEVMCCADCGAVVKEERKQSLGVSK